MNVKTGEKEYLLKYPIEYSLNRGGMQNNYHYLCTNSDGELIISFPACNDLLVYNPKNNRTTRKHAGSNKIQKLFPSEIKEMDVVKAKEQYNKYFFTTPSYEQVLHDKYRNLYLRVSLHPNLNYGKSNSFNKPKSVIFLNENFEFIGECDLNTYSVSLFIYPKGLIIVGYDKNNKKNWIREYEIIL